MRLAEYILREMESIVTEWEAFAATRVPAARDMNALALRDHAELILRAIATDLMTPQTGAEQVAKSRGEAAVIAGAPETAAEAHGLLRAQVGFDINQMVSEYRALRASVLRLWMDACAPEPPHRDDVVRFNEAIDQALVESVAFYSERVDQARNLFLGMLGHDMRTPLQAIQMTAHYLGRLSAGEKVSDAAGRLMSSGGRMKRLLDDLVQFNRSNLGLGIPVDRKPVDLRDLLEEELGEVRTAHPERKLELLVQGPTRGEWDGVCVQRLVGNLVVNAIKYGAPDAPVRVVVDGCEDDVKVEVRNHGVPSNVDTLEGMFEPLRRGLHPGHSGGPDSSLGLGLYIAREIAKAHGGEIHARCENDETIFSVKLPRQARAG